LRIKTLKALKSLCKRGGEEYEHAVTFFTKGTASELLFRKEFQSLLPEGLAIVKASHFTECDKSFGLPDRPAKAPTDYAIIYKSTIIAAIEVTTGKAGYSYASSKELPTSEDKLERMDRFFGCFVVMLVLVGEPRFIWATSSDIRTFKAELDNDGELMHWSSPKIWKQGLNGLADAVVKLAERVDELVKAA
jgi:hypothetical protein